jgi:CHAT domain-containing protein/tetratricopeptide (TPR) repeat protein
MRRRPIIAVALLITVTATILAIADFPRSSRQKIPHPRLVVNDPSALLVEADRLSWLGNWDSAGPLYARAEELFRLSGDQRREIYARIGRVRAEAENTSLAGAVEILDRQLDDPAVKRDPKLRLWCLAAKAYADFDFDSNAAKKEWLEVRNLATTLGEGEWASRANGELGIAAFLDGRTSVAVARLGEALLSAYGTGDVGAQIEFLSVAGVGFNEEHRFSEALSLFHRSIEIADKTPGAGYPYMAHEGEVTSLLGLAKPKLAQEELTRVFAQAQSHDRKGEMALILILCGDAAVADHETEHAKEYYSRAGRLFQSAQVYRGLDEAMLKLSNIYRQQGDLEQASLLLRVGFEANRRVGGHYYLPRALTAVAELETAQQEYGKADLEFQRAEDAMEQILGDLNSDREVVAVAGAMSETYVEHFRLDVQQGKIAKAFQALERVRGRRERILLHAQRETGKEPTMLAALNSAIARVQGALLTSDEPDKRATLVDQLSLFEHGVGILKLQEIRPRLMPPIRPAALTAVQGALRKDEALVEYVLDEPQSFCIVVTREGARIVELSGGRGQIEDLARSFLNELKAARSGEPFSSQLYSILVGPISEVSLKPRLIISPDGALHFVPFEALRNAQGRFLVRSNIISYSPSATMWRNLRQMARSHASRPLLALGAVDYTSGRSLSSEELPNSLAASTMPGLSGLSRSQLRDLPLSQDEVISISQVAGRRSELLLGNRATEDAFKAEPLSDFRVIHLAVHAVADPQYPDRAALVLGRDSNMSEDGLLQAREIVGLSLNADLVTLSACDTGIGSSEGEAGVLSLERAFLTAGARAVVASLWHVEDHATTALMTSFYAHLAQQEDKAVALAHAQRDLLDRYGDVSPYFWAGFVLVGEGSRAISFVQ